MDLEGLKAKIKDELKKLEQRQAGLQEQLAHLSALQCSKNQCVSETVREAGSSPRNLVPQEKLQKSKKPFEDLRCLKCGASLQRLIPTDTSGNVILRGLRLGKSDGADRYLECPQCLAKNIFVRTGGPQGFGRVLITQLKR